MWHRQAAALAAAADRVGVAAAELPTVRARLRTQQASFAQVATATGVPLPSLVPSPTDIAAAMPALGDLSDQAVAAALETVSSTLDAADAALATHAAHLRPPARPSVPPVPVPPPSAPVPPPSAPVPWPAPVPQPAPVPPPGARAVTGGAPPPGAPAVTGMAAWPAGLRNALVYAGYSLMVFVVQVILIVLGDQQPESTRPFILMLVFILPALAWVAGWLTVGAAFPAPPNGRVKRTPRLGAFVCMISFLLLCMIIGVMGIFGSMNR
jgi:hypothetical protein